MTKPIIRFHDTQTDELIDREMTDAEFKVYQIDLAETAKTLEEKAAKDTAKANLLDKLGITADEAKLLLG